MNGLSLEREGAVAVVVLNRPHRINALDVPTMTALVEVFDQLHHDDAVIAVVVAGAGSRGFCAGRDLREAEDAGLAGLPAETRPMRGISRNVFEAVLECGKPVIAALHGHTLGGGAELALACDVRVASEDLSFGFPEVSVGMGANFAAAMLPRMVPPGVALDLLYTGRRIGTEEAQRWGLIQETVAPGGSKIAALRYAHRVAEGAPLTLRRYKAMFTKGRGLPVAAALRIEPHPDPYASQDRIEGIEAWKAHRPPLWSGR